MHFGLISGNGYNSWTVPEKTLQLDLEGYLIQQGFCIAMFSHNIVDQ